MTRCVLSLCFMLLALAACVSPDRPVRSGPASLAGAEPGALLSASPGDTLYSERAGNYSWALSFQETTQIAGYTIEPGLYHLSAVSEDGYVFQIGDRCRGEPTVHASRFSDGAAALFAPLAGDRVCVNTIYNYQRCAPAAAEIIPAPARNTEPTDYALIYGGLEDSAEGPLARFALEARTGDHIRRQQFSAPVSGLLRVQRGAFEVVTASEEAATLRLLGPIGGAPLTLPQFVEPEPTAPQESWAEVMERLRAQTAGTQSENRSASPALLGG